MKTPRTADETPVRSTGDNRGEADYDAKVRAVAEALRSHDGPFVLISHVDPDGDAFGSTLALKRALDALGKTTVLPLTPPRFLAFLARDGELSEPLDVLPDGTLLAVLDVDIGGRAIGAPLEGARTVVNIDHHGTNDRSGDVSLVEPGKAATAVIVKDVIDALGVPWSEDIATPCLTGILTDTGTFRFANTTPGALRTAADLLRHGVAYAELTDRLQMRHPDYFRLLGRVMSTVAFPLGGLVVCAELTLAMREELGPSEDDSDDFVGAIRYAEGSVVALFLKERQDHTKISVRTRGGVSAQRICLALGGGGHVMAAGATVQACLDETKARALEAIRAELERSGYDVPA
jgi:bifunctional oligoribonuclease and PAP phosphatase NrnA